MVLNYIEHLLILLSMAPGCVSVSAFVSCPGIPKGIPRFKLGLKICVITARLKKYKSMIKKKSKKSWWNSTASKILFKYHRSFNF